MDRQEVVLQANGEEDNLCISCFTSCRDVTVHVLQVIVIVHSVMGVMIYNALYIR